MYGHIQKWHHTRRTHLSVFLLIVVSSCGVGGIGDYAIDLPNTYYLARVYSPRFVIVRRNFGVPKEARGGTGVVDCVETYAVYRDYIIGKVKHVGDAPYGNKEGYFVLDTRSGELLDELPDELLEREWPKTYAAPDGLRLAYAELLEGLSEGEWLEALEQRGIPTPPQLVKPLRGQKAFHLEERHQK